MTWPDLAAPQWLLAGVPVLVVALIARTRAGQVPAVLVPAWDVIAAVPHTLRERLRRMPVLLRLAGILSLTVGLAGMQRQHVEVTRERPASDIVILLDASASMLALDVAPDRFTSARQLAAGLIAARPLDRFGLMAFAGRTASLCPLTMDRKALTAGLTEVRAGTEDLDEGTALGAAIVRAIERLSITRSGAGGQLVIITDGASNQGRITPREGGLLAVRHGIRIDAIALGGDARTRYPTELGIVDVSLPVEEGALREIARMTGGQFTRIATSDAQAQATAAVSADSEPVAVERRRASASPIVRPLVALGVACVMLDLILSTGIFRLEGLP